MGDDGGCSITDSDGSLAARVGDGGLPPVLSTRGLRWAHCGGPTCGLRHTVGVLHACATSVHLFVAPHVATAGMACVLQGWQVYCRGHMYECTSVCVALIWYRVSPPHTHGTLW